MTFISNHPSYEPAAKKRRVSKNPDDTLDKNTICDILNYDNNNNDNNPSIT